MKTHIPRLVIAGSGSGVGKTTMMAVLTLALRSRGLVVQCFKCGPDYLDPTWHKKASGREPQNLDSWMMGRDAVLQTFLEASQDADIALIEGVMGLFDGADAKSNSGSTAEIAKILKAPVICALDAKAVARTLLALYQGLKNFDEDLQVKGLLANRVGSRGHLDLLKEACGDELLGGLPRGDELRIPERHLGLHAAHQDEWPPDRSEAWAAIGDEWLEIDRLLQIAGEAPTLALEDSASSMQKATRPCRIAVAFDEAFHFYYNYNFQLLQRAGAELVQFSPLIDTQLPQNIDGIMLGGGYPELYAAQLAEQTQMRQSIRNFVDQGRSIFAECGGLMYLCRSIRTLDGRDYPMLDLLPAQAMMQDKIQALGYTEVEQTEETMLGPAGLRLRAHQFRYSRLEGELPMKTVWRLRSKRQNKVSIEGYAQGRILASYAHSHWASNPAVAQNFVDFLLKSRD